MRRTLASLICLLLTGALLFAPLAAVDAAAPAERISAADECCGRCPALKSTDPAAAEHSCCPVRTGGEPASSQPCDSDCGQCPCCVVAAPLSWAILSAGEQTLEPALSAGVPTTSTPLSTRSDEPLLPPPRG